VKTFDKAKFYGVNANSKHNRYRFGRRFGGKDGRRIDGSYYGHLPLNEFGGQGRQLVVVSIGPAIFNRYILIFIVPSGTQATTEGVHEVCRGSSRSSVEISNYRERALLGSRRERPRHDRTRQRKEVAPLHRHCRPQGVRRVDRIASTYTLEEGLNVRFGSLADIPGRQL
jgi:hypothetical protein